MLPIFSLLSNVVLAVQQRMHDPWATWPFGPGYEGGWLPAILRFMFIGLVLAGILALLRWAFGPGGWLRDKELDEEAAELRKKKMEAIDVLQKRLAAGEIDTAEFEKRKRAIDRR